METDTMKKALMVLAVVILTGSLAFASPLPDFADKPTMGNYLKSGSSTTGLGYHPGSLSVGGLLDPSRLTIDHSASFGVSAFGKQSLLQGLYQSRFRYRLSDPVMLSFLLGVQNLKGNNIPGFNTANSLYGGFALDYRPSRNYLFRIEVQHLPIGYWSSAAYDPYDNFSLYGDRFMLLNPTFDGAVGAPKAEPLAP